MRWKLMPSVGFSWENAGPAHGLQGIPAGQASTQNQGPGASHEQAPNLVLVICNSSDLAIAPHPKSLHRPLPPKASPYRRALGDHAIRLGRPLSVAAADQQEAFRRCAAPLQGTRGGKLLARVEGRVTPFLPVDCSAGRERLRESSTESCSRFHPKLALV